MQATRIAWQPLTPGGVASFAYARRWNLLAAQMVVALVAAGSVVWFLATNWFPVVTATIQQLPGQGEIRQRQLHWPGAPVVMLAENRFLAFTVDLDHERQARSPAHVQVEFGSRDVRCFSLFGMIERAYPAGWIVAFNRPELQPWWGAWSPMLLALAAAGVVAGLFLCWGVLASVYSPVAWLLGFFGNRDLTLGGSWRLSAAALLPGAVVMIVTIWLYGLGALDVVKLLLGAALHLVVGWVYLVFSPFACPPHPELATSNRNPFGSSASVPGSREVENAPGSAPPESEPKRADAPPPARE